jgi:hypothetical protein
MIILLNQLLVNSHTNSSSDISIEKQVEILEVEWHALGGHSPQLSCLQLDA